MKILEKELEDFLFDNLNKKKFDYLRSIGFYINNIEKYTFFRQLRLGSYGIADIVGFKIYSEKNKYGLNYADSIIIELKEGPITEKSVIQILRYKGAIDSSMNGYDHSQCEMMLIGSSVDKELENNLCLTSPFIPCFTYNLSLGGIRFNCNSVVPYEEALELDIPDVGERVIKIIDELKQIEENERNITDTES